VVLSFVCIRVLFSSEVNFVSSRGTSLLPEKHPYPPNALILAPYLKTPLTFSFSQKKIDDIVIQTTSSIIYFTTL